jgi:hypothetical protein
MSTQRRENRPTLAKKNIRGECRSSYNSAAITGSGEFRSASRTERDGRFQIPVVQFECMHASGIAAPPVDLARLHNVKMMTLGTPAATSLQSDCSNTLLVRLVPDGTCRGWSPCRARRHDTRSVRMHLTGLPNKTPLPAQRVSIESCRVYRQL